MMSTTLRYKYRIYPTLSQQESIARLFGCTRVAWNDALAKVRINKEKYEGYCASSRALTQSKKTAERAWLYEVSSAPLQQSLRNLEVAFKRFFKGLKGKGPRSRFPVWKKKGGRQSASFTVGSFTLKNGLLYLTKIGNIRVAWSRSLPSIPKTATITLDTDGKYHVSFTVVKEDVHMIGGTAVGIDLGIKSFAVLSTGEKVHAPDLKRLESKIEKAQKTLSRCLKGSNRRAAVRLRLARLHSKLARIRKDFQEKLSTRLVREYSSITLEDLNVSGMVKNHNLARAVSRQGWRMFRTMVESKCNRYGREFKVISRWEPTSQICSDCGYIWGKLDLATREVQCVSCGTVHDRDINAAKNIVAAGHAETQNGRGGKVRRMAVSAPSAHPDETSIGGVIL